jgi:hypothetical protein
MDLSALGSSLPPGLADAERDMGDKFRGMSGARFPLITWLRAVRCVATVVSEDVADVCPLSRRVEYHQPLQELSILHQSECYRRHPARPHSRSWSRHGTSWSDTDAE